MNAMLIWFFVTTFGVLLVSYAAYIKKQMMYADSLDSPHQRRAQAFLDSLTKHARGDLVRVYRITQEIFIFGLILAVTGFTVLYMLMMTL